MTSPYLETRNVYKRFGRNVVLRAVTFQVHPGEAVALFGANGAGKSTLLRLLATLSRPSRGDVLAFGNDAWESRDVVRARIGVVGHQPYVYPELTCAENLRFFATMFGLNPEGVVSTALDAVGLGARAESPASTLSRGLLQRLNLARATLHLPDVLILDEPDTGLDRAGRDVLVAVVGNQVDRGGAVVFTTHALDFGLELATRATALRDGAISLDQPANLLTTADLDRDLSQPNSLSGVRE